LHRFLTVPLFHQRREGLMGQLISNLWAGNQRDIPCWSGLQLLLYQLEHDPADTVGRRLQLALNHQGLVGTKRRLRHAAPVPVTHATTLPRQQTAIDALLDANRAQILVTGSVEDDGAWALLRFTSLSPAFLPPNQLQPLPTVNLAILQQQVRFPASFGEPWLQLFQLLALAAAPADWEFPNDWDRAEPLLEAVDAIRDNRDEHGWYALELSIGRIALLRGQAYNGQRWLLRAVSAFEEGLREIPTAQVFLRACLLYQLTTAYAELYRLNREPEWLNQAWQAIDQAAELLQQAPLLRHEAARLEIRRAELLWQQHQRGLLAAQVLHQASRLRAHLITWRQDPLHRPTLVAGLYWLAQFERATAGFTQQARLRAVHLQAAAEAEAELESFTTMDSAS
jgi:hypothetical protein